MKKNKKMGCGNSVTSNIKEIKGKDKVKVKDNSDSNKDKLKKTENIESNANTNNTNNNTNTKHTVKNTVEIDVRLNASSVINDKHTDEINKDNNTIITDEEKELLEKIKKYKRIVNKNSLALIGNVYYELYVKTGKNEYLNDAVLNLKSSISLSNSSLDSQDAISLLLISKCLCLLKENISANEFYNRALSLEPIITSIVDQKDFNFLKEDCLKLGLTKEEVTDTITKDLVNPQESNNHNNNNDNNNLKEIKSNKSNTSDKNLDNLDVKSKVDEEKLIKESDLLKDIKKYCRLKNKNSLSLVGLNYYKIYLLDLGKEKNTEYLEKSIQYFSDSLNDGKDDSIDVFTYFHRCKNYLICDKIDLAREDFINGQNILDINKSFVDKKLVEILIDECKQLGI